MLAGVDLRKPTPDPDPGGRQPGGPEPGRPGHRPPTPPPPMDVERPVSWRVDRRFTVAKAVGAVLFALLGVVSLAHLDRLLVGVLAAVALAAFTLRDVLAPVRVAADPGGVTVVTGFSGRRRLAWSQLERIRVDERNRLTLRSQLLELDTGDNLYLYSSSELGAPVADVAERLQAFMARYAR
jgi:hypothetical protein